MRTKDHIMSSSKRLRWSPETHAQSTTEALRRGAAAALREASALLARLASRFAQPPAAVHADPRLEFYAEAGAPEGGALYCDGELVGWIKGVERL
jgi:hypothetical protein